MRYAQLYAISIVASVAAIVMVCVALYAVYSYIRPPEPPLHYSAAEYQAERPTYAPGENLVYTPTLTVRRTGLVTVIRTFWSVSQDTAATLCDGSSAPIIEVKRILPAGLVGDVRGGRQVRIPVPNLPPGDYLLLSSASGPNAGQSVYQVRFSVTQSCR